MKGDRTRKGRHQRKRELGKWETKRSEDRPQPTGDRRPGSPTTHYEPKKVSWALAAKKMARRGMSEKRIAKRLGVSPDDVADILSG